MTGGPPGGVQTPTINSFDASPASISPGDPSMLSWEVSSPATVTIDQGIGGVALTGSRAVTPAVTTVYTLTATNAGGTASATTQVMVSGIPTPTPSPTPTPTPMPTPASLPIIISFNANPPAITSGNSAMLNWSVSNAISVTIDQGIGNVGIVGNATVSPTTTTYYTLTATNAAGWSSATTALIVSAAPPPAGQPDLVITSISRSGSTVSYTIKNQGTAPATTSTSSLDIDGAVKAYDTVPSLAVGASSTQSFGTYSYTCLGLHDTIKIEADVNNAVAESNEGNNEYAKSYSCFTIPQKTI
jgi:hypothetical protein